MISKSVFAAMIGSASIVFVTSALAFEPSSEAEKTMAAWLEEAECKMTSDAFLDKLDTLPEKTANDVYDARVAMRRAGHIVRGKNHSMTFVAGETCEGTEIAAPSFEPDSDEEKYVNAMVAVFEKNGCALSEREIKDLMTAEGYTRDQMDIGGEALDDNGGFREVDGKLTLTFGKCKDYKG